MTVCVDGRRTSIRLEPVMWDALQDIADHQRLTVDDVVTRVNSTRDPQDNLTAAIRVYIVEFYRSQSG
jgi:predicted DNA-binding ribbon-helix-helix protein